jgi:hypothetical protein
MGAPNIQQQLYLKTALNESKDGMFDHPADLDEGYHMRAVRLARAGRYDDATLASNKAEASEMRRGGASKRSIKNRFNKKDYAVGSKAHQRFEKAAAKKRKAANIYEQTIVEALQSKTKRLEKAFTKSSEAMKKTFKSKDMGAFRSAAKKKINLYGKLYNANLKRLTKERLKAGLSPNISKSTRKDRRNEYGIQPGYKSSRVPASVKAVRVANIKKTLENKPKKD